MNHTELKLTSPSFPEGGWIPRKHTCRGENLSPRLELSGIHSGAKSLAVTLDDASHPIFPNYNHWLIWNLPVWPVLPEGIPQGEILSSPDGAVQGLAYGKHKYAGPKPPLRFCHTYVFTVYVLDCVCALPPSSKKREFLKAIQGHILQQTALSGKFQSRRKEEK